MKVEYLPISDLDKFKRRMPKSKIMQEYEGIIEKLPQGELGKLEVTDKDKFKATTVKTRLIRASKSLNKHLGIKRRGNVVIFWVED